MDAMTHRYVCHALAAIAIAAAPGKAVWGGELPNHKLDTVLQSAIADGCSGGPKDVIISVRNGYRKGMGDSLRAHGDKVKAEFKSIDAIAAEVHCDDLTALAEMSTTVSCRPSSPAAAPSSSEPPQPASAISRSRAAPARAARISAVRPV